MKSYTQTDIIQWDVKSWSKALNFWENSVDWSKVSTCLELGGREGGLSLWLAGKEKKTICSDLKDVHLTASPLHENMVLVNTFNTKTLMQLRFRMKITLILLFSNPLLEVLVRITQLKNKNRFLNKSIKHSSQEESVCLLKTSPLLLFINSCAINSSNGPLLGGTLPKKKCINSCVHSAIKR